MYTVQFKAFVIILYCHVGSFGEEVPFLSDVFMWVVVTADGCHGKGPFDSYVQVQCSNLIESGMCIRVILLCGTLERRE